MYVVINLSLINSIANVYEGSGTSIMKNKSIEQQKCGRLPQLISHVSESGVWGFLEFSEVDG